MQKVQTFLREDQKAALRRIGARTGERQSELIRKGVDLLIDRAENEEADWRKATEAIFGMWKDRDDLDETFRQMREGVKKRLKHVYDKT